ncbi:nucleotidyl transferase AbiEii/AbiGii toxin family protein [soil metagenome]
MDEKTRMAKSVHARLLNKAKESGRPFMELLQYYGMEKFLLRMSQSKYAEQFILKGALLLRFKGISAIRPTRDIDLSSETAQSVIQLEQMTKFCCQLKVEEDGLIFEPNTVAGEEIREDQSYKGVRIKFLGKLGNARIPMQIDIGFGDVVFPSPLWLEYPVLLDGNSPKLLVYTLESAIAEKYQAMVYLDLANSRMKDFYDIWFMMHTQSFKGEELQKAIELTFQRRKTELPDEPPTALIELFNSDESKKAQWKAFKRKAGIENIPETLEEVTKDIYSFIWPLNENLNKGKESNLVWRPQKGWGKKN